MLQLLGQFGDQISILNVFRYITFRTAGATITALLFVFLFGPAIIAALQVTPGQGPADPRRRAADAPPHQEGHADDGRPDDPVGHARLDAALGQSRQAPMSGSSSGDHRLRADRLLRRLPQGHEARRTRASPGKARLAIEFAIAGGRLLRRSRATGAAPLSTALTFPFFKDIVLNLGWFFIPFGAFVIVGAGNAVNLTDGLDGLAIVPVMIAAASFGFIAYLAGNAVFAEYLQIHFVPGTGELAVVCGAVHRRRPRLPLVQRAAGGDLHGRHRVAGARRHARRRSRSRPSTRSCSPSSAACSCSRRCR